MSEKATSFSTQGEQVRIVRVSDAGAGKRDFDKLLPSPQTRRWVPKRKLQVVSAVQNGVLSLNDACERYHLSVEEFQSWAKLLNRHGLGGLRATRIQEYRGKEEAMSAE